MSSIGKLRFEEIGGPLVEKLIKANKRGYNDGIIRVWPSGCVMPMVYSHHAERIRRFTVRPDDVWIISYPKSGTTWTQELVWLLLNNLDYEKLKTGQLIHRTNFLEYGCIMPLAERDERKIGDTVKSVEKCKSPRCIKTHLPLQLLPEELCSVKPKIIYVARNEKDVAVSYYHHHRRFTSYTGSCEDFVEAFVEGIVRYGSPWKHVSDFWKIRNEPNILFITYEEMKKDLPEIVERIAQFLNCILNVEQKKKLCEHLSFNSMKNFYATLSPELERISYDGMNRVIEPFFRKGQVESWKEELTPQLVEKINKSKMEQIKNMENE